MTHHKRVKVIGSKAYGFYSLYIRIVLNNLIDYQAIIKYIDFNQKLWNQVSYLHVRKENIAISIFEEVLMSLAKVYRANHIPSLQPASYLYRNKDTALQINSDFFKVGYFLYS